MTMSTEYFDPESTTRRAFERVPPDLVKAAARIPSSTLHEAAGKIGALDHAIKPVAPSFRVCGPAVTVHSPAGDNLWIHRAIYAAQPGAERANNGRRQSPGIRSIGTRSSRQNRRR